MYHLTIGQVSIDALTAAFIAAFLAVAVYVSNETYRRETEKKALREALYSEIGWTLSLLCNTISMVAVFGNRPSSREEFLLRLQSEHAHLLQELLRGLINFQTWKDLKEGLTSLIKLDVYNYANKNPTLFYQFHDVYAIDNFYRCLFEILEAITSIDRQEVASADQPKQILNFITLYVKTTLITKTIKLDFKKLKKSIGQQNDLPPAFRVAKDSKQLIDVMCKTSIWPGVESKEQASTRNK